MNGICPPLHEEPGFASRNLEFNPIIKAKTPSAAGPAPGRAPFGDAIEVYSKFRSRIGL